MYVVTHEQAIVIAYWNDAPFTVIDMYSPIRFVAKIGW